ncbi:Transposase IS66 family protein [Actibacterium lipolyticum]|uniref:Transposase IS66 family protein n=2 Tax=Actibacterium lipolyticum TaxID=1524263 RepID=A0A238KTH1_9RHOB|nr:Transposase IS66 family protein [Actibacterium lipolyticum]
MQEIQSACAKLAGHPESDVSKLALLIANADLRRDLEHDNEIVAKDAKLSTAKVKLKVMKADNRLLRAQLNKSQDMQFGQSSEKIPKKRKKKKGDDDDTGIGGTSPDGGNPNAGGDEAKPETGKPKPRGMLGRQAITIPANIPRDKATISPPNGSICQCGCGMVQIGEQTIERLTYVPAQLRVIEERYPKYVCRDCDKIVQAPVPKRAFEQTRFDDHLIAGLAVSKFADYMPNYRQEQIFKRSGVQLHRSTMGRLMDQAVDALLPLYDVLNDDLKSSSKLLMDETTLAQLMPGTGKTKTCFVWALCRDDRRWKGNAHPGVAFHFKQSRKGEHAEEILDGFKGTLQVDGYAGYNRLTSDSSDGGPINLAYCWAHVRRKFLDVHKATKSDKAHQVFMLINDIYAIEHDLKGQPADVRRAVRQVESAPLVTQLQLLMLRLSGEISMKSTLGLAISYTMKLWDGLTVFLSDGRVEMDNNAVENTIRPIALLRKNALFAGSEIGGRNWAVMASLIGTCRLNGVEPYAYLTWVFEQMAEGHPRSRYEQLLPWYCPNGKFGIE